MYPWWPYFDQIVVTLALLWSLSVIVRKFAPQKSIKSCGGCDKIKMPAVQNITTLGRRRVVGSR